MKYIGKLGVTSILALNIFAGGVFAGANSTHETGIVHVREYGNNHGANVTWNAKSKLAIIEKDHDKIVFKVGSNIAKVNDKSATLSAVVKIENGKAMVPVEILQEVFGALGHSAKEVHWSYEGKTGPQYWDTLHPEYALCGRGKEQSPIDIDLSKVKLNKDLEEMQINYNPTLFTVQNNGHTVQANDHTGKNTIILDGEEYKLLQMHFHIPSENTINGKHYPMEGHLVHTNKEGGLAVIGFLIEEGKENQQLADIWSVLPAEETKKDIELTNKVDLANILPKNMKTLRYSGSLTTPPCSEGVKWIVIEEPIQMSKEQINAFHAIFPVNTNRPTQPLFDRDVSTYN